MKEIQVVLLEAAAMPRAKPEFSEIPDTKNTQELPFQEESRTAGNP